MTDDDAVESRKRYLRGRIVSQAVEMGWLAAVEGLPADSCPYDGDLVEYWLDGYRMVKHDAEAV